MNEVDHTDDEGPTLPPATFDLLTISLRTQAEMQLGLLHFGDEQTKPEPQLELARHTIDLLAMLQEKTRGNLTLEEQRYLDNSVTELRFRYVQVLEDFKKQKSQTAESQQG